MLLPWILATPPSANEWTAPLDDAFTAAAEEATAGFEGGSPFAARFAPRNAGGAGGEAWTEEEPAWSPRSPARLAQDADRDEWIAQLGVGLVTTESSRGPNEEIDFDEGFAANLGIARHFGVDDGSAFDYILGLEAYWSDQDADSSRFSNSGRDFTVIAVLLNGGVEYAVSDSVGLYGILGIGGSWISVGNAGDELGEFEDEDGPFLTWQAKTGVVWQATPSTAWLLGYRFLNADDAEIDDNSVDNLDFSLETQQHVLEVGVQFTL